MNHFKLKILIIYIYGVARKDGWVIQEKEIHFQLIIHIQLLDILIEMLSHLNLMQGFLYNNILFLFIKLKHLFSMFEF